MDNAVIVDSASIGNTTIDISSDTYNIDGTNVVLVGNITSVTGAGGDDMLTASNANTTLTGAAGNDTLTGGDGNDTLNGGVANDRLTGELGNDRDIDFAKDGTLQFTNGGENLNRDELWQAIGQGNLDISFDNGDINITFGTADIASSKANGSDYQNQFGADNQVDSQNELDNFIALLNVDIAV